MTTLLNCVMISTLFSMYVYPPIIAATFLIFFSAALIAHPHCYPLRFVLLFRTLSDHSVISFKIQFSSSSRKHVHMPNFKSTNYAAICDELSCQKWDAVNSCCNNDVQLMMPLLTKSIYPLVTMFHLNLSILSLLSPTMFGNYLKKRKDFTWSTRLPTKKFLKTMIKL